MFLDIFGIVFSLALAAIGIFMLHCSSKEPDDSGDGYIALFAGFFAILVALSFLILVFNDLSHSHLSH